MAYRGGLGELDARISAVRAALDWHSYVVRMRKAAVEDKSRLDGELAQHARVLAREQKDVDKLEGFSISGLFYKLIGKHDDKLDEENKELLLAKLKHDLVQAELVAVEEQIADAERHVAKVVADVGDVESAVESALSDKEEWLNAQGGPAAAELLNMSEEHGRHESLVREIDEAISHGEAARAKLDDVLESLSSATGWGTFDMFGGGLVADIMKHGKIDAAKAKLEEAQGLILAFQRELKDVEIQLDAEVEISGFSKFGDFFFDGLLFDWSVQSKIKQSLEGVTKTRDEIAELIGTLNEQRTTLVGRVDSLTKKREEFIAGWGQA